MTRAEAQRQRVERLARALWNEYRRELQTGGSVPAFSTYSDGAQEPCVFRVQSAELQGWFRRQARRLLKRAKL